MHNLSTLVLLGTGRHTKSAKISTFKPMLAYSVVVLLICLVQTASAFAQLAPNQTQGFGNGRLVTFTYLQNFDCVDQPTMDLDFNHVLAQSDPSEMQTPICQAVTEPTEDPTGGDIKHTAHHAMPCPDGGRPTELCGTAL